MYGYEIFHDDIMKELINSIHNDETRHAYLFTGPKGVGKLKAAKLFAAALTCQNTGGAPCGVCGACIGAKSMTNPDIIYVRPTDKKTITAEQGRQIVADAYVRPFESTKKVYIIEDAAVLNEFAQNCLLKVLEEPPEYVVFIIISTGETDLLQTVLSRCTTVAFSSVSDEVVEKYLKSHYPEQSQRFQSLIALSQGVIGEVEAILSDPDYDIIRQESFKMLVPLMSKHKISAYRVCEFLEDYKEKTDMIFSFWQLFLRDIIMIKNSKTDLIVNQDIKEELTDFAARVDDKFPIVVMDEIIKAVKMNKRYVNLHVLGLYLSLSIKNKLYQK